MLRVVGHLPRLGGSGAQPGPAGVRQPLTLAALYQAQGRYAEAEPLFRRSLAIREKALGPEHPHVAASLHNLAGLYRIQGKYSEAEPLLQRAPTIKERALGPGKQRIPAPP